MILQSKLWFIICVWTYVGFSKTLKTVWHSLFHSRIFSIHKVFWWSLLVSFYRCRYCSVYTRWGIQTWDHFRINDVSIHDGMLCGIIVIINNIVYLKILFNNVRLLFNRLFNRRVTFCAIYISRSVENDIFNTAISLAERYNISKWEMFMSHLEWLFTDSE